jgi:hypothetical protein
MKKVIFSMLALAIICVYSGCPLLDDLFIFDEETFNAEWEAWEKQDLQNYSYIIKGSMHPYPDKSRELLMFEYEAKVIVKNGVFDSYEYIRSNDSHFSDDPDLFDDHSVTSLTFTSISQMYRSIYDWAKDVESNTDEIKDNPHVSAFRFSIKYNKSWHYPTYFYPSYDYKPGVIADTALHPVSIFDLEPLD